MTKRLTVRIGLPGYNGDEFLSTALDSLFDQELSDLELLIDYKIGTSRIHSRSEPDRLPNLNKLQTFGLASGDLWMGRSEVWARECVRGLHGCATRLSFYERTRTVNRLKPTEA